MTDIIRIISHITKNDSRALVYFAIGSANNADQQLPPWLFELANISRHMQGPKYVFLIDPLMENPPKCTTICKPIFGQHIRFTQTGESIFFNKELNITVYRYTTSIKYGSLPYLHGTIDMLPIIANAIELAKERDFFFVVQDFTGTEMSELGRIFDPYIETDHNHIIIGIGVRDNEGCIVDFTNICNRFAYIMDHQCNRIYVFNPFSYGAVRDMVEFYNLYYELTNRVSFINRLDYETIIAQIKKYIRNYVTDFKTHLLTALRHLMLVKQKKSRINPEIIRGLYKYGNEKLFSSSQVAIMCEVEENIISHIDELIDAIKREFVETMNSITIQLGDSITFEQTFIDLVATSTTPYDSETILSDILTECSTQFALSIKQCA